MKPLKITDKNWQTLRGELLKTHPFSHVMVRDRCKEKLGFVIREHQFNWNSWNTELYLDFYDDRKMTVFLIKWGHLLENDNDKAA
jgi:hypothetical protein